MVNPKEKLKLIREKYGSLVSNLIRNNDFMVLTNEQKIKHILKEIKKRNDLRIEFQKKIDEYSVHTDKDVSKARDLINSGIESHKQSHLYRALQAFSSAIRYAPHVQNTNTSDELYLAFHHRSIIHYELKDYERSLHDIKQALDICQRVEDLRHRINCLRSLRKYSKALEMTTDLLSGHYLLTESEIKAMQDLKQVIENEIQNTAEAQEIVVENDCYLFVDDCVDFVESEDRGRYMMSTGDRPKDSLILRERAQYSLLIEDNLLLLCSNCLKTIGQTFFPCVHCTECIFCNKKCYEEAMNRFHKHECRRSEVFYEVRYHFHFAFRILLTTGYSSGKELLQYLDNCFNSGNRFNVKQWIEKYSNQIIAREQKSVEHKKEEFEAFVTFLDHNDSQTLTKQVIDIFEALEMVTLIDISHAFIIEDEQTFISLTNALITIARKIVYNSFNATSVLRNGQHMTFAIVVCLVSAMCNHSCVPNIKWIVKDDKQEFIANLPIRAGHEISDSYGPSITDKFIDRQKYLKNNYKFTCSCVLCANESQGILSLRCQAFTCSGPVFTSGVCLLCGQQYVNYEQTMNNVKENIQIFNDMKENIDSNIDRLNSINKALLASELIQNYVYPRNEEMLNILDISQSYRLSILSLN